jgi:hypothetical protein
MMSVSDRFTRFVENLKLTDWQRSDGQTKQRGVRRCLNSHFWATSSETANSQLVGSWGKSTEVRPPRDIDVLMVLPDAVKDRFDALPPSRNRQSELLQEVKKVLAMTYSTTNMRGDGQVVLVPFKTFSVEVVPAFVELGVLGLATGKYLICDTHDGGRYKQVDPSAEKAHVKMSNDATNGNTRNLVRMMKRWQSHCNVPIKSFHIELLVIEFLSCWAYAPKSTVYYDWMVREFLDFLVKKSVLSFVRVPGTDERIWWFSAAWKSNAESALARAMKACEYEASDKFGSDTLAGIEWQKIFGDDIPKW